MGADGVEQGGGARRRGGALALAALAIALAALALQLGFERRDAFWLDESWTGAIVGEQTWSGFARQVYWDVNAPLYYLVARVWSLGFGLSDAALRAPSLIAAAATPLAAALAPAPGLSAGRRLAWAAVLAWWFPALCFAEEARCYALLLLVCTAQTLAYLRLSARPSTARAALWAALAATAILTHYDALYLGAAQGLVYLARQPRRALATWPAALAFLPAFGWLAVHAPRIAAFARPEVAWYSPLTLQGLQPVFAYMAGGEVMLPVLALVALDALLLRLVLRSPEPAVTPAEAPAAWTAAASLLAAAMVIAMGFLRPSFTFRYLTPAAPGLSLGLVLLMGALAGRRAAPLAVASLAAAYLAVGGWMLQHGLRMAPRRYNFETASAALARTRPERLVFLWDHPVDPILHREELSALGGFFLHRRGLATRVTPVVLRPGEDPNARLLSQAQSGHAPILWLYDTVVRGTAALAYPPRLAGRASGYLCQPFGYGRFGVLACSWKGDAAMAGRPSPAHQPAALLQPQGGGGGGGGA